MTYEKNQTVSTYEFKKNCVLATVAPMCCIHRTGRHFNANTRGVKMQRQADAPACRPGLQGSAVAWRRAAAVSAGAELKMSEIRHPCQQRSWRSWSHGPTRPSQTSCPSAPVIRSLAALPPTPHLLVTPRGARSRLFFLSLSLPLGARLSSTRVCRLNE